MVVTSLLLPFTARREAALLLDAYGADAIAILSDRILAAMHAGDERRATHLDRILAHVETMVDAIPGGGHAPA